MLMGLKLHRDYATDKLLMHNIDIEEGEGVFMQLYFDFFERKS